MEPCRLKPWVRISFLSMDEGREDIWMLWVGCTVVVQKE